MLFAKYAFRSGWNDYHEVNLLNIRQRVSLYSLWLRLLWVLEMKSPEQLCTICQTVLAQYGTLEQMQPRNCVRWSNCITQQEIAAPAAKQNLQINIHGCSCKPRTLKRTGRRVFYCRC